MGEGETVQCQGVAAITRGLFGGRWGPLVLTNKRLLWYEEGPIWPLKRQHRQIELADIEEADDGSLVDKLFGGRRLRVRLRTGGHIRFFEGQNQLDWWLDQLSRARVLR